MLKGLTNFANLLRNAHELQARADEMRGRLAALRVEGAAGGGMVRVEMTGEQKVISINIEQTLVQSGDREMLEDLLASAVNQALEHARNAATEEMSNLAGGLGFPGFEEALAKFGLGGQ